MMAPYSDPRKIPGEVVHAKARTVTNEKLCQRLYGSNWKVKVVPGVVLSVTKALMVPVSRVLSLLTGKLHQLSSVPLSKLVMSRSDQFLI